MKVYNVIGSAIAGSIYEQAEPFSMNVCACNRMDAMAAVHQDMEERGFRGIVLRQAIDLGEAGRNSQWRPGLTLLIS